MKFKENLNFSKELNDILGFAATKLTLPQAKVAKGLEDELKLLIYITSAYNVYDISKCGGMRMILNPSALFIDEGDKQQFIAELKQYVLTTIREKEREPINDGNNDNRG